MYCNYGIRFVATEASVNTVDLDLDCVLWTGEEAVQPVPERRAAALAAALDHSAQSHSVGQDLLHLGPFFGLPSSVVRLLREHRGISELYGKRNIAQVM